MPRDDESIMPDEVDATERSTPERSTPENGSTTAEDGGDKTVEEDAPQERVPWATSYFEVMMGKPLYGAILDAETKDLITQVQQGESKSIHDIRDQPGISGALLYLTEDGFQDEVEIEFSLQEMPQEAPEEEEPEEPPSEATETERLVGALREELQALRTENREKEEEPAPDADKEDLWNQLETLRDRLSKLRDKNQDLLDEIDEKEAQLRKVRNEKRSEISQLRDQRETLRVEKNQLTRERDKLKRRLEKEEEHAEELEETVSNLRDRIDRLKSKVAHVGDEDSANEGFWALLFERLLGEDGMLSDVDGSSISRVMAQLSQQQAQNQPQQVPAGGGQIQRGAGGASAGQAGPVHRAGGQAQQGQSQQAQPQQGQSQQGQAQQAQPQQGGQQEAAQPPQNGSPETNSQAQNQSNRMMDRDEAISDLFKRIIEDSVGRLQGSLSEEEIQQSAALVDDRLDEYRTEQGFEIQPHEWSQLLIELTAAVNRMNIEGEVGTVFCHRLWPMLLVFSDQLEVVNNLPPDMAATTLQNFYESSENMLLGQRIEVTDSMHATLSDVIEVLAKHLGTGERPGGQPGGNPGGNPGGSEEEPGNVPPGL